MAIYSFSAGVFSRSKGHTATAAASYRSGERLRDELTGQTFDYSRKHGISHSEIMAPEGAPAWMLNRQQLWNAVEAQEKRSDSQLAREVLVALPHELDEAERLELVRNFVRSEFVSAGMVADFSIHEPSRDGDERNYHCHCMLSLRRAEADGFARTKAREWNSDAQLEHWREAWAKHCNDALETAGFEARVSHLSLEAQGVDREPGEHMGKRATALERQGIASERGDRNRETAERNGEIDRLVAELAELDAQIAREQQERIFAGGFDAFEPQPLDIDPLDREAWPLDAAAEEAQVLAAVAPFVADVLEHGHVREVEQLDGLTWWERAGQRALEAFAQARDFARDTWQRLVERGRDSEPDKDRDIGPDMG